MVALGPDAGILAARTFLGPDTPVPSGWDTPFRLTGTMHLLSISGFHFSLLGGVLLLAMRVLLRGSRSAKWPAIWLLGGYAWMVGAPAPVQRSWGGALLLAGGPSWGRAGRTVNALGLVAALLALLEPRFPAGPSFVMSFAATAGVILGGRATAAWLDVAKDAAKAQGGHAGGPHRAGEGRGLPTNQRPTIRMPTGRLPTRGLGRARPLLLALGVSVGATFLTVPWSFHWFGLLYPLGALANLVAIPAMAVVMAVQVPALFAVAAGAGAGFPFCAVGRLAGDGFLAILRAMAGVSGAWPWTGQLDRVTSLAWMVVAGVALLAAGRWAEATKERSRRERATKKRCSQERSVAFGSAPGDAPVEIATRPRERERAAVARTVVWVVLLSLPLAAGEVRRLCAEGPFRGSELDVRWLDVGQGDATLVRFAGATWLVDLGLGSLRGRDRLVPQLLRAGVKRVDRAWVTHGDADHWGGLIDLLASPVRLDTLVLGEGSTPPAKMLAALQAARHPPVVVRAAAGWHRQGPVVSVRVLHPPPDFRPRDTNAGSLVLVLESVAYAGTEACAETEPRAGTTTPVEMVSRVASTPHATMAPFRVLLSGDLPREREAVMLASGGPGAVLVAELAHHGSRTASSPGWWESARPRLAVISVGRGNSYGLPHAETLAAAARRGVRVLRTDRDGAVRIAFGVRGASVGRAGPA
jgi:competence protein ComEC